MEEFNGHNIDFHLDQLHPDARVCVVSDLKESESIFATGDGVRQRWQDSRIQRVHQLATPVSLDPEHPWHRVLCPDGSALFIKFLSLGCQLIDESPTKLGKTNATNMKKTPPPKKGASTKKAPPFKKPAKPVAPPTGGSTKTKPVKPPKPAGNYPWLLNRLKAQATDALSTGENRSTIRAGLKDAKDFKEVRSFAERAGVTAETFDNFLNVFFAASINRPEK
jgi:hypothetical protein